MHKDCVFGSRMLSYTKLMLTHGPSGQTVAFPYSCLLFCVLNATFWKINCIRLHLKYFEFQKHCVLLTCINHSMNIHYQYAFYTWAFIEQIYWASTKFVNSFILCKTTWVRQYYYFYLINENWSLENFYLCDMGQVSSRAKIWLIWCQRLNS